MPRIWTCVTFWLLGFLCVLAAPPSRAAQPAENLFPETTKGFLAVASVPSLIEHWNQTQLGRLMADPVMEPFADDLRQQYESRWTGVRRRLGLTLDDLKDVPSGEIGIGVVLAAPDRAAVALVMDVTGNLPKAQALLEKVAENLIARGAKQDTGTVAEGTQPVVHFDVPPPPEIEGAKNQQVYYLLTDQLLVASTDLNVLRGILARAAGTPRSSLATLPDFQVAMGRCSQDAGGAIPQIRWFIHPLGYAEAIRAATPPQQRRKGKPVVEILQNQGLAAVRSAAGFVSLASEGYEMVHRTFVYVPPPYKNAMKMLAFPAGSDFKPQPWVPRDVATYTTFYCDVLVAFDNFGPLFDEVFGGEEYMFRVAAECQQDLEKGTVPQAIGEQLDKLRMTLSPQAAVATRQAGSVWEITDQDAIYVVRKRAADLRAYLQYTGIWAEVLDGMKTQEDGPKIDLRAELIRHLGRRITVISDYELPITTTSERLLYAIETADEQKVALAIEKTMKTEPTAKRREIDGHVVWEIIEEAHLDVPEVRVGAIPSLMPDESGDEDDSETPKEPFRLLPHAAVTVANGHLFIASHLEFLTKVLRLSAQRETLANNIDYRMVDDAVGQLSIAGQCGRSFSRTDEEYRPTYELIRQGRMPESETLLGRVLNRIFGEGRGDVRNQRIDGSKLPAYDAVRRFLGPAGMVVASESDQTTGEPKGWFFKGFTLSKEQ
ncbi:MAG: hypothetical protein JXB62_14995 [Pirellulales bacterium]|nr:hypothetical protein [Pirellulales bacterium]